MNYFTLRELISCQMVFHSKNMKYGKSGGKMYGETITPEFGMLSISVWFFVVIFYYVVQWKVFVKAGKPGWGILIPIYNTILILEIAGKPWWWLLLMMIPLVNIVIAIMIPIEIAKSFNKSIAFGIGLLFLPIIFYAILAFDKDIEYWGDVQLNDVL